jgi:hypothetical protein
MSYSDLDLMISEESWQKATCPRCNEGGNLEWFNDGGEISSNGQDYWQICCDVDEAFCKKCNIHLPICPLCTSLTCDELEHPEQYNPQEGDLQFLTFLGCDGYIDNHSPKCEFLLRPNYKDSDNEGVHWVIGEDSRFNMILDKDLYKGPYTNDIIGLKIPYIIDNPLPGFDESVLPSSMIPVGPDGGYPTYWWCTKCKIAQTYTDK